jgi:hypothetical protein
MTYFVFTTAAVKSRLGFGGGVGTAGRRPARQGRDPRADEVRRLRGGRVRDGGAVLAAQPQSGPPTSTWSRPTSSSRTGRCGARPSVPARTRISAALPTYIC